MNDDKDTKKLLSELVELMNENDLAELEIEEEGCRIRLRKNEARQPERPVYISAPPGAPGHHGDFPTATQQPIVSTQENLITIKSPMVGTFYRASGPDSDPFVEANDTINEETVVAIIEAMKVMNEIKAECRGVVKDILVANGEPVEYGQPLFLLEPA
ncbi:MAG TPA: acetyl-CoA carboxylase biotin carboxyl carrier protein [Planctomycetota bacterium]|nr:acetyl-CoA carboxylase biotin carboxyl carrier protein [Planctomycetota bacterium]